MITFRLAKKKDVKKVQIFLSFNFKKNHILSKNKKFFKWLYVSKRVNCLIAESQNKIVGIYLFTPLSQFDKNLKSNQIFLSTWTIEGFKKENRKNDSKKSITIAYKMMNEIYKILHGKFTINVGIDTRLVKFHDYKKIFSKPSNHHFIISPNVKKLKILKEINKKKYLIKKNKNNNLIFNEIKNKNHFYKHKLKKLFNHQVPLKSEEYLLNRYLKHPIYKYRIFIVSENNTKCLCVLRIVKIKNTNVIRMIDYVGENKTFPILRDFFLEILKKFKAEYLDFYSLGIPLKYLEKSGLINKKLDNHIIPDWFNPLVYKNIEIFIGCLNIKKKDKAKFRIFKGDGDQDRPS